MSRSRSEEVRLAERARIVLACLDSKEIQQVAAELGRRRRSRFAKQGVKV